MPDFKLRDDILKKELLCKMNEKRIAKGKMPQSIIDQDNRMKARQNDAAYSDPKNSLNFEFKLLPFPDEDQHLILPELPKKLKFANK